MIAEIIKILPLKQSRTEGIYYRVEFKDENGKWWKTDLVTSYRNFARWKPLLKIGNMLTNLTVKGEATINADSWPRLFNQKVQALYDNANRLKDTDERAYFIKYLC